MTTIAILNPKGGSGKTTLATNLACALSHRGFTSLLVDSDPQGSARDWHAALDSNPVDLITLDRPGNFASLGAISRGYDFTVIDGAAKLEQIIAAAIKVADLILIPVQPSPLDLWATSDLIELIELRQQMTGGKPRTAFVISRAVQSTLMAAKLADALAQCPFPVLNTPVVNRQAYPQMSAAGLSVLSSNNPPAKAEMIALSGEVLLFLNQSTEE